MNVTIDAPEQVIGAVGLRLVCKDRNEQVDSCDLSKWKVYAGKLDWNRVANSVGFDVLVEYANGAVFQLVSADYIGSGDHAVVIVRNGQSPVQRIIPAAQIIPTIRLFVSSQVARNRLAMRVKDCEQIGALITDGPDCMIISKRV